MRPAAKFQGRAGGYREAAAMRPARQKPRWRPRHDALQTLRETVTAARPDPLIR